MNCVAFGHRASYTEFGEQSVVHLVVLADAAVAVELERRTVARVERHSGGHRARLDGDGEALTR